MSLSVSFFFLSYNDILFIFVYNTLCLLMHRTFDLKWCSCHCCARVYTWTTSMLWGRACFNEHASFSPFLRFCLLYFFFLQVVAITCAYKPRPQNVIALFRKYIFMSTVHLSVYMIIYIASNCKTVASYIFGFAVFFSSFSFSLSLPVARFYSIETLWEKKSQQGLIAIDGSLWHDLRLSICICGYVGIV